eukprot:3998199-Pleurochrysis_carterae.AAC.6
MKETVLHDPEACTVATLVFACSSVYLLTCRKFGFKFIHDHRQRGPASMKILITTAAHEPRGRDNPLPCAARTCKLKYAALSGRTAYRAYWKP